MIHLEINWTPRVKFFHKTIFFMHNGSQFFSYLNPRKPHKVLNLIQNKIIMNKRAKCCKYTYVEGNVQAVEPTLS